MTNVTYHWGELFDPGRAAHTHAVYARMRDTAAFVPVSSGETYTHWIVTRYDESVEILKDNARLTKSVRRLPPEVLARFNLPAPDPAMEIFEHMLLLIDPPDHTRLRKLVHKAFTLRLVEDMRPDIQQLVDSLIDRIQAKGTFDLIQDYALPVPITVIAGMLGVPKTDQADFRRWSQAIIAREPISSMKMAAFEFIGYMNKLIAQRRADPQQDLLSGLIHVKEEDDALTHSELVGMIFLLLIAGHETIVNLIGNGMLALAENPDQMAQLRANPALIRPAVEEMLRYNGPLENATDRWALTAFDVDGGTVQPGDRVSVGVHSANRDPRKFAQPDAFDITRDPNPHIAFGSGIHYCLGAQLARLEAALAVQALITRLPRLRLVQDPETLPWLNNTLIHGVTSAQFAVE